MPSVEHAPITITRATPWQELPEWLTAHEVADYLDLSRNGAYDLIRRGEIPSRRIGRAIRIPRAALAPDAR
jgi:excisionase family DNA binding protein